MTACIYIATLAPLSFSGSYLPNGAQGAENVAKEIGPEFDL